MKRRDFVKQAAASSMGVGLMTSGAPFILRNGPANEKVVVAVMGTNSRGSALAKGFAKLSGAEVAYICDVEDGAMANGMAAVEEGGQKNKPKGEKDIRKVLEDPDVDAIVIAAPDHWHAPAAMMALNAGKHVYVEKPCSHNPREGEMLVEAAKKHQKVVQMGNQRRSWPHVQEAIQLIKDGTIGKPYFARAWYANTRQPIGRGQQVAVPEGLDYELWQGPAPRRPYQDNLIHYNWHWFWHWGTGEILNNGTHQIDLCRWGLGVDYPIRVSSGGGRYAYDDDWETPDTQSTYYDFEDGMTISWEGRSCNGRAIEGVTSGCAFHGNDGSIAIQGNGYTLYDAKNKELKKMTEQDVDATDTTGPGMDLDQYHLTNFREAVRSGETPNTPVDDGNISVHLCHLGNIAHRTQQVLECDPTNGRVKNSEEAQALWGREYEPGWTPAV